MANAVVKTLDSLYKKPESSAGYGGKERLYRRALEKNISRAQVDDYLLDQQAYTLHRERRKRFPRNRIVAFYKHYLHEADLSDMQMFTESNDGVKYLLCVIDVLSKYLWVMPLMAKTGANVKEALEKIHKEVVPNKLRTDRGTEFKNRIVQAYLKKQQIEFYTSTNATYKCAVVERVQRTLKKRIGTFLTDRNTERYIDHLQDFVKGYNNSLHRVVKTTPKTALTLSDEQLFATVYGTGETRSKRAKLAIGTWVRTAYDLTPLDKGNWPLFTDTLNTVEEVNTKAKPMYRLSDYYKKPIARLFYREELQPVKRPVFRIKVHKKRTHQGKKQTLVSYIGYDEKKWIDDADLEG
jgi:hypothetical protein